MKQKHLLFALLPATFFLMMGGTASAGLFQSKGIPNHPPHNLAPEWVCVENCAPKQKVVKTHTVELCRRGFTKWEEHCCGIKIKGNYMRVTYETFYSNGCSTVWEKEYRS